MAIIKKMQSAYTSDPRVISVGLKKARRALARFAKQRGAHA